MQVDSLTTRGLAVLTKAGMDVHVTGPESADLVWHGQRRSAVVRELKGSRDHWQLSAEFLQLARPGRILIYIAERIPRQLNALARQSDSLATVDLRDQAALIFGEVVRLPGAAESQRRVETPKTRGRVPYGRFALMRSLLRTRRPRTQGELARECGATQVAVSQNLNKLGDLVSREAAGWVANEPDVLWSRFLAEYPGPGGYAAHWFGLDPVVHQAEAVMQLGDGVERRLGGDVAGDLVAPWRRPRRALVYARSGADLAALGMAETISNKASLTYRVPRDQTCWSTAVAWSTPDGATRLMDPLLTAWDIDRAGTVDEAEQVEHLRQAVMREWASA